LQQGSDGGAHLSPVGTAGGGLETAISVWSWVQKYMIFKNYLAFRVSIGFVFGLFLVILYYSYVHLILFSLFCTILVRFGLFLLLFNSNRPIFIYIQITFCTNF
jgi:hypothetical protein